MKLKVLVVQNRWQYEYDTLSERKKIYSPGRFCHIIPTRDTGETLSNIILTQIAQLGFWSRKDYQSRLWWCWEHERSYKRCSGPYFIPVSYSKVCTLQESQSKLSQSFIHTNNALLATCKQCITSNMFSALCIRCSISSQHLLNAFKYTWTALRPMDHICNVHTVYVKQGGLSMQSVWLSASINLHLYWLHWVNCLMQRPEYKLLSLFFSEDNLNSLFPFVLAETFFHILLLSVITFKIQPVTLLLHHQELKRYVISSGKMEWHNMVWYLAVSYTLSSLARYSFQQTMYCRSSDYRSNIPVQTVEEYWHLNLLYHFIEQLIVELQEILCSSWLVYQSYCHHQS